MSEALPLNRKPRVLILSASSGAGHIRAAQALEKAFIACIATHFLPAEILAWLIARNKLQARHAIVVTDYDVHAMWLCRTVDRYYVALPESAEYLARIGVPREKLRVTGISVDPVFEKRVNPAEVRKRLGVDANAQVVLIAAGGYGLGPVEQLVKALLALQRPWQIVAIAGKSEKLKKRLEQISRSAGKMAGGGQASHRWLHSGNGSVHGGRRFASRESRRVDDVGGAGASIAHGYR